jgi:small subunit ribosomal protein S20
MANIKSAQKRILTTKRNTERNKTVKTMVKTLKKKAEGAISTKAETKQSAIKVFLANVDAAVSKGVFHKNKAARLKSRLMKKANKAK